MTIAYIILFYYIFSLHAYFTKVFLSNDTAVAKFSLLKKFF